MTAKTLDSEVTQFGVEMLIWGIFLALGCAAAQIALVYALGYAGLGDFAWFAGPVVLAMAHGFFIVVLADWGMRRATGDEADSLLPPLEVGIAGALGIGLPVMAIFLLMTVGIQTMLPDLFWLGELPWALTGWTLVVLTALPVRIAAGVRGTPVTFKPLTVRLPGLVAAGVPVWALGYLLDSAPAGLMEGGMIVVPFALLYIFAASYLAAWLSAKAVRA